VKEYTLGHLIYEGQYLNGKRNGNGKEYDLEGKITFEGVFFIGKRWEGKGFIKNNLFIFDGTYKNGQLNGNVKEYNKDGQLTFEGEYIDGKRNGILK